MAGLSLAPHRCSCLAEQFPHLAREAKVQLGSGQFWNTDQQGPAGRMKPDGWLLGVSSCLPLQACWPEPSFL